MQLIFLFGPVAAGKLTIARVLAARSDYALFHNHLIVDAVGAVFPFGTEAFSRLREQFWLDVFSEAARQGRSVIFTFAPEPTVAADFPERVRAAVAERGGEVVFVALTVSPEEQERRLVDESRAAFGKMRDIALLRRLRPQFDVCMRAMPPATLTLDVGGLSVDESAAAITRLMTP